MPIYLFQNQETAEIREVFFRMNDDKNYRGENGNENNWKRVFTIPTASVDGKVDAYSSNSFVEVTSKKRGTVGDILDLSAELSEKRAASSLDGQDPVKKKYFDKYKKDRFGKDHPLSRPKSVETSGLKIDF